MGSVFTVSEVVRLLRDVEGRRPHQADALTARAVRYYARTGMVEPSMRMPGDRGARLYTLTDVALLRLAWLLRERWRLPERAVWGLLVYRAEELRTQLEAGQGAIVVEDAAAVSPGQEQSHVRLPLRIPVSVALAGLRSAAQRLRRSDPELWSGTSWVSPAEAWQHGSEA